MIGEKQKDDYTNKLNRFLANPSSAKEFYDNYKAEHSKASFEDYTKALEELVGMLEEEKVQDQQELCKKIKELKLPHNQFDC